MEFQFETMIKGAPFLGPMINVTCTDYRDLERVPFPDETGDVWPIVYKGTAADIPTGALYPGDVILRQPTPEELLYRAELLDAAQQAVETGRKRRLDYFLDLTMFLEGAKFNPPYPYVPVVEPEPAWLEEAVDQYLRMFKEDEGDHDLGFVDGGITVDDIAQDEVDRDRLGEHDPHGIDAHAPGAKLDAGKNRLALVLGGFARAIQAVGEIGTAGAKKYTERGWLRVPDGVDRYSDALMRHLAKEWEGEMWDQDSGQMHAAHAAWNALARLELLLLEQESTRDN